MKPNPSDGNVPPRQPRPEERFRVSAAEGVNRSTENTGTYWDQAFPRLYEKRAEGRPSTPAPTNDFDFYGIREKKRIERESALLNALWDLVRTVVYAMLAGFFGFIAPVLEAIISDLTKIVSGEAR